MSLRASFQVYPSESPVFLLSDVFQKDGNLSSRKSETTLTFSPF